MMAVMDTAERETSIEFDTDVRSASCAARLKGPFAATVCRRRAALTGNRMAAVTDAPVVVEATHAPAVHVDPDAHVHDIAAPPADVDDVGHAVHVVPSLRYSFTLHVVVVNGVTQAASEMEPCAPLVVLPVAHLLQDVVRPPTDHASTGHLVHDPAMR